MSIKSILCIFAGGDGELFGLDASMALAETYGAKLRILHISADPSRYVGLYGENFIGGGSIIEAIEKENNERLEKAKQAVISAIARHNIVLDTQNSVCNETAYAHARFIHLIGDVDSIVASQGRLCDIIVIGRDVNSVNALYDSVVISALFDSGHPVLLMPAWKNTLPEKWQCKTVSLAWNGGLEVARAVYNSLPFLERAQKVQLLTVRGNGEACDLAAEDGAIEYLKCHNIYVTGIIVAAGNRAPAEALLARAKELETDLLVMGAYGHSRFREMILGGMTNYMLENADIPLLLTH